MFYGFDGDGSGAHKGDARLDQMTTRMRLEFDDDGLQKLLRSRRRRRPFRFELLVQHALVPRVHIHEDQPIACLREDVNPVKLRKSDSKVAAAGERIPGQQPQPPMGCELAGTAATGQRKARDGRIAPPRPAPR